MPPTDAVLHMKFSHATVVCAKGETKLFFIAADIQRESDSFPLVFESIASYTLKVTKLRLQISPLKLILQQKHKKIWKLSEK